MSTFETFVQAELPKRPFLQTDAPQNSVIIRSGIGPRQLSYVTINQGEVLTVDGSGNLVSANLLALSGIKKYSVQVTIPSLTWILPHNLNSEELIVQCFDTSKYVIIPDAIQILNPNQVRITFGQLQTGTARIIFLN